MQNSISTKSELGPPLTRAASKDNAPRVAVEKLKVSALACTKMCDECVGPEAGGQS